MSLSLSELIAKWREGRVGHLTEHAIQSSRALAAMCLCADELEAALAAEQTEAFDLRHDYPEPENALADARRSHALLCTDPEVCVEDHGPGEQWIGCNRATDIVARHLAALRAVSQPTREQYIWHPESGRILEMPTREQIKAAIRLQIGDSPCETNFGCAADAVLALYGKSAKP